MRTSSPHAPTRLSRAILPLAALLPLFAAGCSTCDLERAALARNQANVEAIASDNETLLESGEHHPDLSASVRARNAAARRLAAELAQDGAR